MCGKQNKLATCCTRWPHLCQVKLSVCCFCSKCSRHTKRNLCVCCFEQKHKSRLLQNSSSFFSDFRSFFFVFFVFFLFVCHTTDFRASGRLRLIYYRHIITWSTSKLKAASVRRRQKSARCLRLFHQHTNNHLLKQSFPLNWHKQNKPTFGEQREKKQRNRFKFFSSRFVCLRWCFFVSLFELSAIWMRKKRLKKERKRANQSYHPKAVEHAR